MKGIESVAQDVERGISLRNQLETISEELKEIEARLRAAGLAHPEDHMELADEKREGRQWLAQGPRHVVPVVFTADLIVGQFKQLSPLHQSIRTTLGRDTELLTEFFKAPCTWENRFDSGKKFRAHANEVLGSRAPAFVMACTAKDKDGVGKSAVKVEWERATKQEAKVAA